MFRKERSNACLINFARNEAVWSIGVRKLDERDIKNRQLSELRRCRPRRQEVLRGVREPAARPNVALCSRRPSWSAERCGSEP